MFSPSGFTALLTARISVLSDKIEPVSIYNIQVNIWQINIDEFELEALIQRNRSLSECML